MNIFIYRPDKAIPKGLIPDLCFTSNGLSYRSWRQRKDEEINFKKQKLKEKLDNPPEHKVLDYWR